jgi:acetylornithine/LysW-gamma-L-lysine aminotransferase
LDAQQIIAREDSHSSGMYHKRQVALVRGEGTRVWDADGREYLDCTAGIGVAVLGHAHPVVVEALREQAARLVTCHELFYNDQRAALLDRLDAVTPSALDRFFLSNSGTEANEAAIKFARASTGRPEIVSAMRGYHGKTFGALSATWGKSFRTPFEPLVPGFRTVPFNRPDGIVDAISDSTAAVLVEVVQGEGGVRPATTEYLETLRTACTDRGALLIIDEVQTGFGRTGKLFAFEHHGVEPDILTLAKSVAGGVPMGVTAFGEAVGQLPKLSHTTTFGGNPLACAVADRVIAHIVSTDLPAHAAAQGRRLLDGVEALSSRRIREVRGLGLMIGIELKQPAGPAARSLMDEGILVLLAGSTVLRLLPPLVIQPDEVDRVIAALGKVLA